MGVRWEGPEIEDTGRFGERKEKGKTILLFIN